MEKLFVSVFRQHVKAVHNKASHDYPPAEQQKQRRILDTNFGDYEI